MQPYMIKKDDPRLPDSYGMEVYSHGETSPSIYEITEHRIIDKIYESVMSETGPSLKCIGPAAVPFLEYTTREDKHGFIPLSSIKKLEFDERYSKLVALKKEQQEKQRITEKT